MCSAANEIYNGISSLAVIHVAGSTIGIVEHAVFKSDYVKIVTLCIEYVLFAIAACKS